MRKIFPANRKTAFRRCPMDARECLLEESRRVSLANFRVESHA